MEVLQTRMIFTSGITLECFLSFCPQRPDTFFVSAVMDISDLIKGKIECDEEKQFFIPFFPYVFCHF